MELEVLVVEFTIVPVEGLGVLRCHKCGGWESWSGKREKGRIERQGVKLWA